MQFDPVGVGGGALLQTETYWLLHQPVPCLPALQASTVRRRWSDAQSYGYRRDGGGLQQLGMGGALLGPVPIAP